MGYFYFGQDGHILGEDVRCAGRWTATGWLLDQGYTNILVDVANERRAPVPA